jgi:hypothetical protein
MPIKTDLYRSLYTKYSPDLSAEEVDEKVKYAETLDQGEFLNSFYTKYTGTTPSEAQSSYIDSVLTGEDSVDKDSIEDPIKKVKKVEPSAPMANGLSVLANDKPLSKWWENDFSFESKTKPKPSLSAEFKKTDTIANDLPVNKGLLVKYEALSDNDKINLQEEAIKNLVPDDKKTFGFSEKQIKEESLKILEKQERPYLLESWGAATVKGFASFANNIEGFKDNLVFSALDWGLSNFDPEYSKNVGNKIGLYELIKNLDAPGSISIDRSSLENFIGVLDNHIREYSDKSITEEIINGDYLKAGERAVSAGLESLPSVVAASLGLGGIVLVGMSAAGGKFEEELRNDPTRNTGLLLTNSIVSGTIEAGFELATRGVLQRSGILLKEGAEAAARQLIEGGAKTLAKNIGEEGASEAATQITSILWDSISLGRPIDWSKEVYNIVDAGIVGGVMGGGITIAGSATGAKRAAQDRARTVLMSDTNKKNMAAWGSHVSNLYAEMVNATPEVQKEASNKIKAAIINMQAVKQKSDRELEGLAKKELVQYATNIDRIHNKKVALASANPDGELGKSLKADINELKTQNDVFLADAYVNYYGTRVSKDISNAKKILQNYEGVTIKDYDTDEEVVKALIDIENKTPEEAKKLASNNYGTIIQKGGQQTIYINKALAIRDGVTTTGQHEAMHAVLYNAIKNNRELQGKIGLNLLDEIAKLSGGEDVLRKTKTGKRLLEGEGSYYNKYESNVKESLARLDRGEITEAEYDDIIENEWSNFVEEVLPVLSEAITEGVLDFQPKFFDKLKSPIRRFLQNRGLKDINLKTGTGKDIFNFVQDYNKGFSSGKLGKAFVKGDFTDDFSSANIATTSTKESSKLIIDKIKSDIEILNQAEESGDIEYEDYQRKIDNLNLKLKLEEKKLASITAATESIPKAKELVSPAAKEKKVNANALQGMLDAEKGDVNKMVNTSLTTTPGGNSTTNIQKSKFGQAIGGLVETITRRLYDGIPEDAKRTVSRDDYKNALISNAATLVSKEYDPAKQKLDAFVSNRLNLRANSLAKELGIEGAESAGGKGIGLDLESAKGIIADNEVSNTSDKPTYKNLLERNIISKEAIVNINKKILTIIRTLKSRIDAPVSLNKTVTPIIAEIRDAFGKQIDIDLKTEMGGKKDGVLRKWLLTNKRGILENLTTTWLMGKDVGTKVEGGMPQAIQKRVDGKWLNYPDWAGKKVDREAVTTDNAGRTAGHELTRRLKNAHEIISNEEFIGTIIGADGNPLRGKKESLAKALAEEIAFDIVSADLYQEGELYDALKTNQERLGYEVANNMAVDIARQAERGNVKYSIKILTGTESEVNAIINFAEAKGAADLAGLIKGTINDDDFNELVSNLAVSLNNALTKVTNAKQNKEDIDSFKTRGFDDVMTYVEAVLSGEMNNLPKVLGVEPAAINAKKPLNEDNKKILEKAILPFAIKLFNEANTIAQKEAAVNKLIMLFGEGLASGRRQSLLGTKAELFKYVIKTLLPAADPSKSVDASKWAIEKNIWGQDTITFNKKKLTPGFSQTAGSVDVISLFRASPINNVMFKERAAHATMLQTAMLEYAEWLKGELKANNINIVDVGFMLNVLNNGMKSAGKAMAPLKYALIDSLKLNFKQYTFEHVIPSGVINAYIARYIIGDTFTKQELQALLESNYVAIIPRDIANIIDSVYKSGMDINWLPGLDAMLFRYFNTNIQRMLNARGKGFLPSSMLDLSTKKVVKTDFANVKGTQSNEVYAEAVEKQSIKYKEPKGITVMDFDDTLATTKSNVLYTMPDGSKGKLNAEQFAKESVDLADNGAKFDFSEFSKVNEGAKGPMFERAKGLTNKFGNKDVFVLTARPADADVAIHEFLKGIGLELKLENIIGLGDGAASAKANWMLAKVAEGYNDFYFSDDVLANVKAVKNILNQFDVKSDVVQAKVKFSLKMNEEFNQILEDVKGIEKTRVYSDVVAKRQGAGKGKWRLFLPPSAEDFAGLLYDFLGKGKDGEKHMEFFMKSLIDPYTKGIALIDSAKRKAKNDFRKVMDSHSNVAKKLGTLIPTKDFTHDQAIRVFMWTQGGQEIPGMSATDLEAINNFVENDPELLAFSRALAVIGKQDNIWVKPGKYWDTDTITSDLNSITEKGGRKAFLAEFIENADIIFSKENLNKIEANFGTNSRQALEDSLYRMKNGKNRTAGMSPAEIGWNNWVNNSTGAIMFFNTRSALLQLLSTVNFINWTDNNPLMAAAAFANQPQYWKDFAKIFNSDKLKERRAGLKSDVSAAEIANAASNSKNKAKAVLSYLLKIGFLPTQIADSFAISAGGSTFYRNRVNTYVKAGMEIADAEAKAWEDFSKTADETQQSGDPMLISQQQASSVGRLILAFANTPLQYNRLMKKAARDLVNGRGDPKTHISKILYYGFLQNLIFSGLQTALFAMAFDDDDDEEKAKKLDEKSYYILNGMLDTILRGAGIAGAVVSTIKNAAKKYLDEKDKGFKADYAKVLIEAANLSPPIGSKFRKLYTGMKTNQFESDVIAERGFSLMADGRLNVSSAWTVAGKTVEATTNFPLDRLVAKLGNVAEGLDSRNASWQRIALLLGWKPWDVGATNEEHDLIKAGAKAVRKKEGAAKAKATNAAKAEAKKDSIAGLTGYGKINYDRIQAKKKQATKDKRKAKAEAKKDSISNLSPEDLMEYEFEKAKAKLEAKSNN